MSSLLMRLVEEVVAENGVSEGDALRVQMHGVTAIWKPDGFRVVGADLEGRWLAIARDIWPTVPPATALRYYVRTDIDEAFATGEDGELTFGDHGFEIASAAVGSAARG